MRYTAPVSSLSNTIYWTGLGTEDSPYLISSADDVNTLAQDVINGKTYTNKYFLVTTEINLGGIDENSQGVDSAMFTPIGDVDNPFKGIFDGGGNDIKGLYINKGELYIGLFANLDGATIKNLNLYGTIKGSSSYVGAFAGKTTNGTTFTNCHCYMPISGGTGIGGIAGDTSDTSFYSCSNDGTISAGGNFVGGIAAFASNATFSDCHNTANISGGIYSVGGLIGAGNTCTLINCGNSGNISGSAYIGGNVGHMDNKNTYTSCYNTGDISGQRYLGGIAGYPSSSNEFTKCYTTGAITSQSEEDNFAGGIVGIFYNSSISESYNTGEISAYSCAGGIVGIIEYGGDNSITNSYNRGNITVTENECGGIIGRLTSSTSSNSLTIESVYSTADVTAGETSESIGTFFGSVGEQLTVVATACYNLNVEGGIYPSVGSNLSESEYTITPLSSDDMQLDSFVTSLSESYWTKDTEWVNDGYPILSWQ